MAEDHFPIWQLEVKHSSGKRFPDDANSFNGSFGHAEAASSAVSMQRRPSYCNRITVAPGQPSRPETGGTETQHGSRRLILPAPVAGDKNGWHRGTSDPRRTGEAPLSRGSDRGDGEAQVMPEPPHSAPLGCRECCRKSERSANIAGWKTGDRGQPEGSGRNLGNSLSACHGSRRHSKALTISPIRLFMRKLKAKKVEGGRFKAQVRRDRTN